MWEGGVKMYYYKQAKFYPLFSEQEVEIYQMDLRWCIMVWFEMVERVGNQGDGGYRGWG